MITSCWHVRFTPTELPSPSTRQPFVAELPEDWEEWLRRAEVVPGTPFLLSPTLEYDVTLKGSSRASGWWPAPGTPRPATPGTWPRS
jgi:hypothetical protein